MTTHLPACTPETLATQLPLAMDENPALSPTDTLSAVQMRLWAIWHNQRQPLIRGAYRIVRCQGLAEDMASQALLRLASTHSYDNIPDRELLPLLYTTTRNLCLSYLQSQRKLASPEWFDKLAMDDAATNQVYASQCLAQLANEPEYRATMYGLLEALALDGPASQVVNEAARLLGIQRATMRQRLSRMRKALGVDKLAKPLPRLAATGCKHGSTRGNGLAALWHILAGTAVLAPSGEAIAVGR